MGRPCKCCEEVSSSSSSSLDCQCTVRCDLIRNCTDQEFMDMMDVGLHGVLCECMGGVCNYDMASGDWEIILTNQVAPQETNQGDEVNETNIWGWGGHTGSTCLTHYYQYLDEYPPSTTSETGDPSCGQYVANPFYLPSPFPSELPHGGPYSGEWLDPPDPDSRYGLQDYGTHCRPHGPRYCHPVYALWDVELNGFDRGTSIGNRSWLFKDRDMHTGTQEACGNQSGYACAHMTECIVEGKTILGGIDIEECICTSDGCEDGGPRIYPTQGGMIVGVHPDREKYGGYPFDNGQPIDPCSCVQWTITYKGTSTPPTVDNCRCWTFQVGGAGLSPSFTDDPYSAGARCPFADAPQFTRPSFCFYAESHPVGQGIDYISVDGTYSSPNPPYNDNRLACCGCDWICGCGQQRAHGCGTAECTKGDGGDTTGTGPPPEQSQFAIQICIGCLLSAIDDHGSPTSLYPPGVCDTEDDVKFQCPLTDFDGDVCDEPEGDPDGACCVTGGNCVISKERWCTGEWQGPGTTCDPDPCEGGPETIRRFPDAAQNHPLAPRGAPIMGPKIFGDEGRAYYEAGSGEESDCTYICFDGVWYPLDDHCSDVKYQLPTVTGTDGQTIRIQRQRIGMIMKNEEEE